MKVVLEIKGDAKPKHDDILVYDSVSEAFVFRSKYDFLKEIRNEVKGLRKDCEKTQSKCVETQNDVSNIAKIVKEGMK